jgi:hypothetical protein
MKKIIGLSLLTISLYAKLDLPIQNINTIYTSNEKFEPSGIYINNEKLYSISDNGILLTMNLSDKIENYHQLKKKDFEDITFSKNDNLYLIEEGKDNIIELDTLNFQQINKFDIDRTFNGNVVLEKGEDGLESLSFVKETETNIYFYSANQSNKFTGTDASAIFLLEINKITKKGKIIEYFPMKIKDISSIDYKNDNLIYFISDKENSLFITNKDFKNFKKYNLPGKNQEGIYLDEITMILYIAQDSGNILEIQLDKDLK